MARVDRITRICWSVSTLLHLAAITGVFLAHGANAVVDPATDPDQATIETGDADSEGSASIRFVAVPEQAAVATVPILEPTELPPLPGTDNDDPLDGLLAIDDAASAPQTDEDEAAPPPLLEPTTRPVAAPRGGDDTDLTTRYREFAAQISNRLMVRYRTHWHGQFRHRLRGDEILLRLDIRNSSVMGAELLSDQTTGDPVFDHLLLDFLNRPAREGRPLNALAVPDRVLIAPIRFR